MSNDQNSQVDQQALIAKVLEEASGGQIKDLDGLKGLISEHSPLQARVKELEAKQSLNPFANEFVSQTNEFFAKGGSVDEFYEFLSVKKLDPEKMAPLDMLRYDYRSRYKGLNDQEIDALIRKDIGSWEPVKGEDGTEKPVDLSVQAEMKRRSQEIATKIKETQTKLQTPAAAIQAKQQEEKQQQLLNSMQQLVGFAVKDLNKVPLSLKDKEKELFNFEFELPKEFSGLALQAVMPLAIEAFQKGTLSVSQADFESKTVPQIKAWATQAAWAAYGPQIAEVMVRDALAKASKEQAAQSAGMRTQPHERGKNLPEDWVTQLKAKALGRTSK